MNKEALWEQHYNENLKPFLHDLEEKRLIEKKQRKRTITIMLSILIVSIIVSIAIISTIDPYVPTKPYVVIVPSILLFISMILLPIMSNFLIKFNKKNVLEFKDNVIKEIMLYFDKDAKYSPEKQFSRYAVNSSRIFQSSLAYTHSFGEDLGEMTVRNKEFNSETKIKFSELTLLYIYKDSEGEESTRQIFKGLYCIIDFNKDFNCELFLNTSRRKNLILEDVEFNKLFKLNTNDQVQSRYILSTTLMEGFKNLYKEISGVRKIRASFLNNKLYLALHTKIDRFEYNLRHNLLKFENIKPFYEQVESIISILNTLNLNTKI